MARVLLRLRWSWRDLRARWLQVAAIALVIGIGSGVYSGLSSTSEWRRVTYDESYEALGMWDLHLELAEGSVAPVDELLEIARTIDDRSVLAEVEPRLVVATQVDASTDEDTVLVPGRLVGVDVSDGGPHVAQIHARSGRGLEPSDADADVVVLEERFAAHYDLDDDGSIAVSGAPDLEFVGRGVSPEYFIIIPPDGTVFGEANFAVAFASIETVQRITGLGDDANELVVRVEEAGSRDRVEAQLVSALTEAFPDIGITVRHPEDDRVLRTLYDDIDTDQQFNNIIALLVMLGAAFAAFNLTGRIVEAQRREIGIGMALGAPPRMLAARTLLVGAQIALLGVVFGVAVGYVIQAFMADVLQSLFPLPAWHTDFQPTVFARGAALGFVLPFVATAVPVWRAVQMAPVDAIRSTRRVVSGGIVPVLSRIWLPGRSIGQLPFRNVMRTPRRTLMTALGIGAAITTLVGVLGMIDSYLDTLDRGQEEILGDAPDRIMIDLEFAPVTEVEALLEDPLLETAEPVLSLGGVLDPGGDEIEVFVQLVDLDSPVWTPTVIAGSTTSDEPGLVLARKAARDLGIDVGDRVTLRHPVREGLGYRLVDTDVPVIALHPNPLRFASYMDIDHAPLFGLAGITNAISATPSDGVTVAEVQRELFGRDQVVSVQPLRAGVDAIRDRIQEFVDLFRIVQFAVLLLALLIAFNSTSINVDERRREHATMFAYGLPVRSVMRVSIVESLIIGVLGTVMGILAGWLLVEWLTRVLVADQFPDLEIIATVASSTVATALALGIAAVVLAPLLTLRKLRRMDIPSTLRVME